MFAILQTKNHIQKKISNFLLEREICDFCKLFEYISLDYCSTFRNIIPMVLRIVSR